MSTPENGRDKVVGVLGGMGPEATIDFYSKLLRITPAKKDQEHLHVIIDSNGKIPDRSAALRGEGESPVPAMQAMAKGLQAAGAELIAIACNTAHYYYQEVQDAVSIPVLHIQKETYRNLQQRYPDATKVGLLATTMTVKTGLFQKFAGEAGVQLVLMPATQQETLVSAAIAAVKAGDKSTGTALVLQACAILVQLGAEVVIAGCTEIPLVLTDGDISIPVIDSSMALAEATLAMARSED